MSKRWKKPWAKRNLFAGELFCLRVETKPNSGDYRQSTSTYCYRERGNASRKCAALRKRTGRRCYVVER